MIRAYSFAATASVLLLLCASGTAAPTWSCSYGGHNFCSVGAGGVLTWTESPYTYYIALGTDISSLPESLNCFDQDAPGAQIDSTFGFNLCSPMGHLGNVDWSTNGSKLYTASFAADTSIPAYKYNLKVQFVCGDGEPTMSQVANQQNNNTFIATVPTKSACSGGGGGGLNFGDVFIIIFFVGGFLFLCGGFAYKYKFKEARGTDAIPLVEFWKDLPSLVKDGFLYSLQLCRLRSAAAGAVSSEAYSEIA